MAPVTSTTTTNAQGSDPLTIAGEYKLVQVVRPDGSSIHLPEVYIVRLSREETNSSTANTPAHAIYQLSVKIGNSMGGQVTVEYNNNNGTTTTTNNDRYSATVSRLFSTRMMVPPELDAIERGLSEILPSTDSLTLVGAILTFHGANNGGMVVCLRAT